MIRTAFDPAKVEDTLSKIAERNALADKFKFRHTAVWGAPGSWISIFEIIIFLILIQETFTSLSNSKILNREV